MYNTSLALELLSLDACVCSIVESPENAPTQMNAPPPIFLSLVWGAFQIQD